MANYKRAYSNGIKCIDYTDADRATHADLMKRAAALKEEAREIVGNMKGDFHFGARFNDVGNIANRAISYLPREADADLKDEYVIAAYIDAASADHWYTYEKQWE